MAVVFHKKLLIPSINMDILLVKISTSVQNMLIEQEKFKYLSTLGQTFSKQKKTIVEESGK